MNKILKNLNFLLVKITKINMFVYPPRSSLVSESEVSAADFLLGRVAHQTCVLFTDAVLGQHSIGDTQHLCADIG